MIQFTFAEFDAELKRRKPSLATNSDFNTLRNNGFKQAMSKYQAKLIENDDTHVRSGTWDLGTPPTTGATPKLNTDIGDVYELALATGAEAVADNTLFIKVGTTYLAAAKKENFGDIVLSGTEETVVAWYMNKDKIMLYVKEGTFAPPAEVQYNYYRTLDTDTSTSTAFLDILSNDYGTIVEDTLSFISDNIPQTF